MNKVSIILARGIEGCGVTKYTVEQVKWLRKNGYTVRIHAAKDKNYSRKNAHDLGDINLFKFADAALIENMIQECNNSDLIIINSLPSKDTGRGAGSGDGCVSNWIHALKSFTKPVVLIQHDHTVYSIKRNAALDEAIEAADIIFAHARTNDFSAYVKQLDGSTGGSLMAFLDEEVNEKKIFPFQPGHDFDSMKSTYWKSLDEQDHRHHKWIGRCTSWKGYKLMFNWHNNHLKNIGAITTFEGIEKSPAFLGFKELSSFENCIDIKNPDEVDFKTNHDAYVFGPYVNHDLLHRMSRCGFGYQLSILDKKYIERSIEYTHCEVAGIGIIPVFRREYGQRCIHRVTGDPLIQSSNSGTIWLNEETMEGNRVLIEQITQDPVLYDELRNEAFEFYKAHQDSDFVFVDMMQTIKDNL